MRVKLLFFIFLVLFAGSAQARDLTQVSAAIQVSSTISDGKHSLQEIISIARSNNIQALVITDRDLMRWEYGLWPLRNIIKRRVEEKSIFRFGIKLYLEELNELRKRNPEIILIPGVESSPFYNWEGNLINKSLKLTGWHRHLLAIGLDKYADYRELPVMANKKGVFLPFRIKDLFLFWPLLLVISGWVSLSCGKQYTDDYGRRLCVYSKGQRLFGHVIIVIGLLFLFNNYPFRSYKYDQYSRNAGIAPYQNFIDYVNKRGGLVFWAHPQARNVQVVSGIEVGTNEYPEYLLMTRNYTGYTLLYDGYDLLGKPGGIWDQVLLEYCRGKRSNPSWAIAGLGFDSRGDLDKYIKGLRQILLVESRDKTGVMNALRKGRIYLLQGELSPKFILDKFKVKDSLAGVSEITGGEISPRGRYNIEIAGRFLDGQARAFKIKLIRSGEVVKIFEGSGEGFEMTYPEEDALTPGKAFYRIEIRSDGLLVISNPIFVNVSSQI